MKQETKPRIIEVGITKCKGCGNISEIRDTFVKECGCPDYGKYDRIKVIPLEDIRQIIDDSKRIIIDEINKKRHTSVDNLDIVDAVNTGIDKSFKKLEVK